jgi:hypothetical protein
MKLRLFHLPWNGKRAIRNTRYPSKATAIRGENGVSLVEMLVALSLTAFLLGVISQFLFTGVKFWAKNDLAYRRQHQLKVVFLTTYSDISSAFIGSYLPDFSMSGDEYQLNFWRETAEGLVLVKYRFEPPEHKVYRSAGFWGGTPPENELFTGIDSWKFEYYQTSSKNWLLEWKPERKDEVPSLIRITVKSKLVNMGTLYIPLKVWRGEEKTDE